MTLYFHERTKQSKISLNWKIRNKRWLYLHRNNIYWPSDILLKYFFHTFGSRIRPDLESCLCHLDFQDKIVLNLRVFKIFVFYIFYIFFFFFLSIFLFFFKCEIFAVVVFFFFFFLFLVFFFFFFFLFWVLVRIFCFVLFLL